MSMLWNSTDVAQNNSTCRATRRLELRVPTSILWRVAGSLMLAAVLIPCSQAWAQVGGIYIDPRGVLHEATAATQQQLDAFRDHALEPQGDTTVQVASALRKISIKRLIQTMRQSDGQPLSSEIRYLAGLTGVRYVLFYPESQDVVLAGPAEPWMQLKTGEVVGRQSRRPVLHLDDLVMAVRFAMDFKNQDGFIGCSIEPTQSGVSRLETLMRRRSSTIKKGGVRQAVHSMQNALGPQQVKFYGIPTDSVFALKMLAADYRLKRIALGHDRSPVKQVRNYLDLETRRFRNGPQPQHRWWFIAKYDALQHSEDRLAFEFVGSGLEVRTGPSQEDPQQAGTTANRSAREFAEQFTRHVEQMAAEIPVFGELKNLVGLAVAAQLIVDHGQTMQKSLDLQPLLEDDLYSPIKCQVPQWVESLAAMRLVRGKHWLIAISGGVDFDPRKIVRTENWKQVRADVLNQQHQTQRPTGKTSWWWD